MKINRIFVAAVCAACAFASCISGKDIVYLQDMDTMSQIELENKFEATISPYDELQIVVTSFDQELARPFNLNTTQYGTVAGANNYSVSYLVDVNGNIQFPILGEIHVSGMTRLQLQDNIAARLKAGNYIRDPYVMVRFYNYKIFFLSSTGGKSITIPNERCTFLEALALCGGIDAYTQRDRIAVVREVNGKMTMRYLDPRSTAIFNDPYFLLQQNDIILLQSMGRNVNRSEASYWINIGSIVASFVATFVSLYAITLRYK